MQSGFSRSYGTGINNFSQVYDISSGTIHDVVGAAAQPYSNVNTTRMQGDPTLNVEWSGYSQQFFNEDRYLSSDVPGGSGYETAFNSNQVERTNDTFVAIPSPFLSGFNHNSSRWGGPSPTSSRSFVIWTKVFG